MIEREKNVRGNVEIVSIEEMVPKDHLLRKIDVAVDFHYLYGIVESLYCADNGRPGIDPVVLFKIVLLQHIYGIPSLRQTLREVQMNIAYRWFLGYGLTEAVPHFATVSYAFRHRFGPEIVEQVFAWILEEIMKAGYLSEEAIFIDGTHVKASANLHKAKKKQVTKAARAYEAQLRREVNEIRETEGKEPFDDDPKGGKKAEVTITESTTDPDCGLFHKGEHRKCFAYGVHTACDAHNYILDAEVTAGNLHDSLVFDTLYERLTSKHPDIDTVVMDAGYKTPWISKRILDDGRMPSLPYKRPMTKKGNLPWYDYVYDEYYDQIICPTYRLLSYATTNREGRRVYKSRAEDCRDCQERVRCTKSKDCRKVVERHIWQDYLEQVEDIRHSPWGKASYSLRKETIERVFADAKEKHGMRFTHHRGLEAVTKWVKMKFAAMNLKKFAVHKARFSLWLCLLGCCFLYFNDFHLDFRKKPCFACC